MALADDGRQLRVIPAASMGLFAIQLDFFSMQAALEVSPNIRFRRRSS